MSYIDADDNSEMRKVFEQYKRYDPELLKLVLGVRDYTFEKVEIDKGALLEYMYVAYKHAFFEGMNKALDMAIEAVEKEKKPRRVLEEEVEAMAETFIAEVKEKMGIDK